MRFDTHIFEIGNSNDWVFCLEMLDDHNEKNYNEGIIIGDMIM